jgi:large subunit ribosomal protein L36e
MEGKTGLFVGLNKGFIVNKMNKNTRKEKISYRKGALGSRVAFVREVVREIVGLNPYEKKMVELIRTGNSSKEKKAYKVAKQRLGTHRRALIKKADIEKIIAAQKKK